MGKIETATVCEVCEVCDDLMDIGSTVKTVSALVRAVNQLFFEKVYCDGHGEQYRKDQHEFMHGVCAALLDQAISLTRKFGEVEEKYAALYEHPVAGN